MREREGGDKEETGESVWHAKTNKAMSRSTLTRGYCDDPDTKPENLRKKAATTFKNQFQIYKYSTRLKGIVHDRS